MESFIPGLIMSFREGLEAFLILILIFKFLEKTGNKRLNISVIFGFISSVFFSLLVGFILHFVGNQLNAADAIGKIWESVASLLAVGLITTFIVWMIQHGSEIQSYVENKTAMNLSRLGVFFVSFVLISREGVEIAIFTFAGKYNYLSIVTGITISLVVALIFLLSLAKTKISLIFKITLIYLIIQAGYLTGYGLHEGLSALKSLNIIQPNNFLLVKLFDLSNTILEHKEGIIGLPFNIVFGWHSKPEWIQFAVQYTYTIVLLFYWHKVNKTRRIK